MEEKLLTSLILTAVAIVLIAVELIIPSAGLISATAAIVAVASIVVMFMHDTGLGLGLMLAWCILGPLAAWYLLKIWTSTPMGRALLGDLREDEKEQIESAKERSHERTKLLGLEGEVISALRPVGAIRVNGQRLEARAEFRFIDAGTRVKIIAVDSMEVRVRPVEG